MSPLDVDNVLIVVIDALRWDHLPNEVAQKGVSFKTVAASTHTPPSFFSIFTGRYPPQHGVTQWSKELPNDIPTIFDVAGVNSSFEGEIRTYGAFDTSLENDFSTAELEPPFFEIHRSGSTHAPYPHDGSLNSAEYYASRTSDTEKLREEYRQGAEQSVDFLEQRISELKERSLLDNTLIIYTSDHGELLGEHGEFDHTAPMSSELIYVPSVFIHEDLSPDDFAPASDSTVIEHVDITTTALAALGVPDEFETMGSNLFASSRKRDQGFATTHLKRDGRTVYQVDGVWGYDGGHVMSRSTRIQNSLYFAYQLWQGPSKHQIRRNLPAAIRNYLKQTSTFGDPDFSKEHAQKVAQTLRDQFDHVEGVDANLSEDVEQRLQELGYQPD